MKWLTMAVTALFFGLVCTAIFAEEQFSPGQQIILNDAGVGPANHYVVFLPSNYVQDKAWPAIFCYHGLGEPPNVFLYQKLVGGKDFVLIGMDYRWDSMDVSSKIDADVETAKRLIPQLVRKFNLDPNQLFIAGNSAGGFAASGVAEATSSFWAGLAILGAGRYKDIRPDRANVLPSVGASMVYGVGYATVKSNPVAVNSLVGKPIYLGAGDLDTNLPWAKKALDYYKSRGADAVLEVYPGASHGNYPSQSKIFQDWLVDSGPFKQANAGTAVAQQSVAAGNLGQAYAQFVRVAAIVGLPPNNEVAVVAKKSAEQIAKEAQGKLDAAQQAVSENRYDDAIKILLQVARAYKGSEFGDQAAKALSELRKDTDLKKKSDEAGLNAQALVLENKAQEAEKAKDYLKAFGFYDQYFAKFKGADRYEVVKEHYDFLKADPEIQLAFQKQKVSRDCQDWMSMAENFLKNGSQERAKEYLQKIIAAYGDTEWAGKARQKIQEIG